MKDLAERALNAALVKGASYADVRAIESRERHLSTRNGVPAQVRESESLGLGVRVIADGAWGFAATDLMTLEGVEAVAARAVAIARSSALGKKADVVLAAEQKIIDSWEGPAEIDPFQIPISQSLDLLLKADAEMRRVKGVTLGRLRWSSAVRINCSYRAWVRRYGRKKRNAARESLPSPFPAMRFRRGPTPIPSAGSIRFEAMNWCRNSTLWAMPGPSARRR